MSVYTVKNDPLFRWGPTMNRFWHLPGTGEYGQTHSKPRNASRQDMTVGAVRSVNESKGGMREYNNHHAYFEDSILFRNLDENATHFLFSLLAWANQGNQFRMSFDSAFDGVIGNVTTSIGPGDTTIWTDYDFPDGNFEAIIYNHLGQFDKLWVQKADPISLTILTGAPSYSELTYNYTANMAIVKYAYYFHQAEALQSAGKLSLRPGAPLYSWAFSFRELMDVSMLS